MKRLARFFTATALTLLFGVAQAHAQQKINMRIASVVEPQSTVYVGTDYFQKRVQELTNGRVEVTVYKGSLGKGERQLYEALQLGTLEGAVISTGPLSAFVPEADLFNLPFLFKNTAHAFKVVDGEIGDEFNKKMIAKGFRVLGWWVIGTRNTSNRTRPINSPEDYRGLKIRTMESPPFIALYKAFGAIPVPMAITEVYTALSQGVIDGIDGSLPAQLEFKHIEVLEYAAVTDHVVLLYPFSVPERWWQGLPNDIREAIVKAEAEARPLQRKADEEYNKKIEEEWRKQGKTVTHPNIEPFQRVAETIYPQFYDKVGGKELIDRIRKIGEGM
ncbi:MAG TPA: TRAP transporter substrate-binding protein [Alphaproteobacteria bacterium]